jgi:signal transduction histidine kinase
MKLRTRFLLVFSLITVIMIVSVALSTRIVLTQVALHADEAWAVFLLQRGQNILKDDQDSLLATAGDWASGADPDDFITTPNPRFSEVNWVEGTFDRLRVDAIVLCDANDRTIAGAAVDSAGRRVADIPAGVRGIIERDSGLLDQASGKPVSGYLFEGDDLFLIAAVPIPAREGQGLARGTWVMVRRMDSVEMARLCRMIGPSFGFVPVARGWPPGQREIQKIGLSDLRARVALADIFGQGRIAFELTLARTAYNQVTLSSLHLIGWMIAWGAGIWLFSVWILNRWVLRSVTESVSALQKGIASAGTTRRTDPLLKKIHDDEIGELVDAINSAIAAVETFSREADRRRAEAIHSQRLAALGTLAAGVAHEINNPNGIVNLNSNVLRRELERLFARIRTEATFHREGSAREIDQISGNFNEIIDEILMASKRIAGIVDSLKSFTKPVSGLEKDRVDIPELIHEAAHWLRHEFKQTQFQMESCCAPDVPELTGMRTQLLQVFVNLFQNACQAATHPNSKVRVAASCDRPNGMVVITVADDGIGLSPEDVERALDPFFTTRRNEGGMGLGLSISAAIVKAHGGRLQIESREGEGTMVTVMLPFEKEI